MRDISLILCYNRMSNGRRIMSITAFIGHRKIYSDNIREQLNKAILTEIQNGCNFFIMGTHGDFDKLALSALRKLRKIYNYINIEVVVTSLNILKNNTNDYDCNQPYSDVDTVIYEIENVHFKQRITFSNRKMIDNCDTLICYVNEKSCKSGAKNALSYAKKKGVQIINLFKTL